MTIQDIYTNDKFIDNIDKVTLAWYILIFIIIIYVFSKLFIQLNIVFGTLIAFIIIIYLYNDYNIKKTNDSNIKEHKKNMIMPKPKIAGNNNDIINYLFSIQDFYSYNPQAYILMIEHIDHFFDIYNETLDDNSLAGINYNTLTDIKRNALNDLQSIIYKMPLNLQHDKKLSDAISMLNIIFEKYLKNVKNIYDNVLYKNGYNTKTVLIPTGPKASNTYDDDMYTYEYY